jgi:UDP-N-acetylglucosamine acyltransferase
MAMISGVCGVTQDIPPFVMAEGHKARIRGFNTVGMRRNGVSNEARRELKMLLRMLYNSPTTLTEALARLEPTTPEGAEFIEFYRTTKRGIAGYTLAGRMNRRDTDDAAED